MEVVDGDGGDTPDAAPRPGPLARCARRLVTHLCSNVGLFCMVVAYALVGALLFEFLESDYEMKQRGRIQRSREDCLKELWVITERLNVLYERNWTRLVHEQLRKFETSIVAATKVEGYDGKDLLDSERQWSFSGSLLYSITVITTIGYGNLAPKTPEGKIVTMLYALIGVPLMLLCLSSLGSLLAETFQFIYSYLCCVPCGASTRASHRRRGAAAANSSSEKKYTHSYHRAPTSPNHHRHQKMRDKHEAVSIHRHTEMHEIQMPRKTLLATVNAGGRPKLQSRALTAEVHQLLTECNECPTTPVHAMHARSVPLPPRPPQCALSSIDTDDGDDADDSEHNQGLCPHDTPSRIPLIWRPPDGGESSAHSSSPQPAAASRDPSIRVPVIIVLIIITAYVCVGAAVFAAWEDWSFLDGAYFCFTTLSTIGFGDLVPGKSFQGADTRGGQLQLVACCAYLLVGLVIIAMSFSLVQEEVVAKCRQLAVAVGLLKRH